MKQLVSSMEFKAGKDFKAKYNKRFMISKAIIDHIYTLVIDNNDSIVKFGKKFASYGDEKDWIIWDICFGAKYYKGGIVEGNIIPANYFNINGCDLFKLKVNGTMLMFVIKGNEITLPFENEEFPNGLNVINPSIKDSNIVISNAVV